MRSDVIVLDSNPDDVTMTSLEMVDFINSLRGEDESELTHANFLAKVVKVLGERSHLFECDLPDSYGRARKGYRFPEREACLMAMSYNYELQAKVYDHMRMLKARLNAVRSVPQDFESALRLAADQQAQIKRQQVALEQQAPKVEFANAVIAGKDLMSLTEAAKELGVPPRNFVAVLAQAGWIYRRRQYDSLKPAVWLPASSQQAHGILVFKKRPDERGILRDQTLVTGKGLSYIRRLFA